MSDLTVRQQHALLLAIIKFNPSNLLRRLTD